MYIDSIHHESIAAFSNHISTMNSTTYIGQLNHLLAQTFIAGYTLKAFAKEFGGTDNNDKGVFPYEAITTTNYNYVLTMT